jgi:pimeloyl-ACP methyl ester carboxylesterase
MTTFVLVPGFWLGAWAWRPVTTALRAEGHEVHPVTLTGLAERAHLATPETNLDTHITDVVNLLRYEDLTDVVLVGHSYGGLVTTAVADRVPERVRALAYVDTGSLAALTERSVPQPWASAVQPVRLTGAWERFPRFGILSSFTVEQTKAMAAEAPLFRHMAGDGWTYEELPTWHWPMFSRPAELADLLNKHY